jgi:hypothetical protein
MKTSSRWLRALLASSALLAAGWSAHAAPVHVTVSAFEFVPSAGYGKDTAENGGTLLDVVFAKNFTAQSFSLESAGEAWTFGVGSLLYQEPSRKQGKSGATGKEIDGLDVTARLSFSSPLGKSIDLLALGEAKPGNGNNGKPFLKFEWADAIVPFGNGGKLGISLNDLVFTGDPGIKHSLDQKVTVTLLRASEPIVPTSDQRLEVPEPGTFALAIGAVALLGVGRRRRPG